MKMSIVMDRFDWQKDGSEWIIRHLVSSIERKSTLNQIEALVKCAKNSNLYYEHSDDIACSFSSMISTDSKWLVRIILPPSNLHSLIISTELTQLSDWKWDIIAELVGVWMEQSNTEADLILNLRSKTPVLERPNNPSTTKQLQLAKLARCTFKKYNKTSKASI